MLLSWAGGDRALTVARRGEATPARLPLPGQRSPRGHIDALLGLRPSFSGGIGLRTVTVTRRSPTARLIAHAALALVSQPSMGTDSAPRPRVPGIPRQRCVSVAAAKPAAGSTPPEPPPEVAVAAAGGSAPFSWTVWSRDFQVGCPRMHAICSPGPPPLTPHPMC
jgi:hypothetical protein